MGGSETCPHCGAVRGAVPERRGPLEALYQEIARIREIAERQETDRRPGPRDVEHDSARDPARDSGRDPGQSDRETIARLTREVQMLRETVARLRGTTHRAATARPAHHVRSPAA
ncbi:MAG TPA: hypothetical protein VF069_13505 [Streptosporangiaceae bacterium]